jgi:hypothetical protein
MNFHTHNPMSRLMKSQIKEPRARALLFFNLNIDNESDVQVIDTTIDSHVTIRSFKRLLPPYLKIVKNVKSLSFSLSYRIYVITFLPFKVQVVDIKRFTNTIRLLSTIIFTTIKRMELCTWGKWHMHTKETSWKTPRLLSKMER